MKSLTILPVVALSIVGTAGAQTLITPTSLTNTSGVSEFFPLINIINDSGLSETATIANYQAVTHAGASGSTAWTTDAPNGAEDYLLAASPGTPAISTFALGATYDLTDLVFWGYHFGDGNGNEVREFSLSFSEDGGTSFPTSATVSNPLSTYAVASATTFDLGGTFRADTVQIDFSDNHFGGTAPGGDRLGVGEIKFIGTVVPEPSNAILCALGGGLLFLRRFRS